MLGQLLKLIRPTQWLKNFVVLAALVFAGEINKTGNDLKAFFALVIFCLLSSAVYIFNDFIDREQDRQHPIKKDRPLASGKVSAPVALILMFIFAGIGLTASFMLNMTFFYFSAGFVLFNLLYTVLLKNIVIVDVMSVSLSFVIRAYAGAAAISVPASKWMLINTLLLSLFLSFGKRRHELVLMDEEATAHRKSLSHYSPYLLDQMMAVVTSSVVVMYMLYSFSSEVSTKLGTENLYLTIPFVVYGIFRYLYLIHKKEKGGSPTSVLINDWPILATVLLWILTVILILYVL